MSDTEDQSTNLGNSSMSVDGDERHTLGAVVNRDARHDKTSIDTYTTGSMPHLPMDRQAGNATPDEDVDIGRLLTRIVSYLDALTDRLNNLDMDVNDRFDGLRGLLNRRVSSVQEQLGNIRRLGVATYVEVRGISETSARYANVTFSDLVTNAAQSLRNKGWDSLRVLGICLIRIGHLVLEVVAVILGIGGYIYELTRVLCGTW
ncbi:hypothetical protein K474DRAFT_1703173 [Panus rudis PR-1116 ss-1]|nr:hypothetical protein K474DRAFT_1703173 [Panus rudis PR-1116 ss-1]